MRNASRIFLVTVLILGMVGCSGKYLGGSKSTLVVAAKIDLAKETKVNFAGTGFSPGEEVVVLFTDINGIPTDIGYALKPKPKADADGNWITTWDAKRFIQKKLIKAGDYKVSAANADYKVLDSKSIKFTGKYKKKKKKKK